MIACPVYSSYLYVNNSRPHVIGCRRHIFIVLYVGIPTTIYDERTLYYKGEVNRSATGPSSLLSIRRETRKPIVHTHITIVLYIF